MEIVELIEDRSNKNWYYVVVLINGYRFKSSQAFTEFDLIKKFNLTIGKILDLPKGW